MALLIIIVRQWCLATAVIMVERVHDQEDVEVDRWGQIRQDFQPGGSSSCPEWSQKLMLTLFQHMLAYAMYITTYLNPNMIFFGA